MDISEDSRIISLDDVVTGIVEGKIIPMDRISLSFNARIVFRDDGTKGSYLTYEVPEGELDLLGDILNTPGCLPRVFLGKN